MSKNGEGERRRGVNKFQNTVTEIKVTDIVITQFIEHGEKADG